MKGKEMIPAGYSRTLIERIEGYVDDMEHRYAIALEGSWGSGKTQFVEKVLKPHLEERGVKLIRVSMFGVACADDLYDRVAAALLHLGEREGKAWHGVKIATDLVAGLAEKAGLSLNLSVSMRSVVGFLLSDKCLLVLDDVERRSEEADEMSLFGAVNDMVESAGARVMLVSTPLSREEGVDERAFDKEIREKLVWKVLRFEPSPSQLARDVLGSISRTSRDVDTPAIVVEAAEACGCDNARAMIRAEGIVGVLCGLEALDDGRLPLEGRENALRDAVRLALMTSLGRAPQVEGSAAPPEEEEMDPESTFMEQREWERYGDFPTIGAYLDPYAGASAEEIESGFRSYLAKWYPDDLDAKTIKDVASKLERFTDLEDEEVESLAEDFSRAMSGRAIPVSLIGDAMGAFVTLDLLGFSTGMTEDDFAQRCRESIDQNPREAVRALSTLVAFFPMNLGPSSKRKASIARMLLDHAEASLLSSASDPSLFSGDMPGSELAKKLGEFLDPRAIGSLPGVSPALIAEVFLASDAKGQEEIRAFFLRLARYPIAAEDRNPEFIEWARRIKEEVGKTEARSRTGRARQKYFESNLCMLLRALGDEPAINESEGA